MTRRSLEPAARGGDSIAQAQTKMSRAEAWWLHPGTIQGAGQARARGKAGQLLSRQHMATICRFPDGWVGNDLGNDPPIQT